MKRTKKNNLQLDFLTIQYPQYADVNCKINGRSSFKQCRDCYFYNTHNTRRQYVSRVLCQEANRIKE